MNAYEDEQFKLDETLDNEAMFWAAVAEVQDTHGFKIRLKLVDGEPQMYAEKM